MTILEQIKALCKTMGIPVKYADQILKSFGVEKEDQVKPAVENFNTNIFPIIKDQEAAAQSAVVEYEKKHGLKDGKPVEPVKGKKAKKPTVAEDESEDESDEEDLGDLPAAYKKLFKVQQKQIKDLTDGITALTKTVTDSGKMNSAKKLFDDAKLPEKWFKRIDVNSEASVEDQIKELQEEYKEIRQGAVSEEVESGNYRPYVAQPKDRTEKEWLEIMNKEEGAGESSGVASLGIE